MPSFSCSWRSAARNGSGTSNGYRDSVAVENRSPLDCELEPLMSATADQCRWQLERQAGAVSGPRRVLLEAALRALEQLPDLPLPRSVKDAFCREFAFI